MHLIRVVAVAFFIAITVGCGYLALASQEAPPDMRWAYRLLYVLVGLGSAGTAVRLLFPPKRLDRD